MSEVPTAPEAKSLGDAPLPAPVAPDTAYLLGTEHEWLSASLTPLDAHLLAGPTGLTDDELLTLPDEYSPSLDNLKETVVAVREHSGIERVNFWDKESTDNPYARWQTQMQTAINSMRSYYQQQDGEGVTTRQDGFRVFMRHIGNAMETGEEDWLNIDAYEDPNSANRMSDTVYQRYFPDDQQNASDVEAFLTHVVIATQNTKTELSGRDSAFSEESFLAQRNRLVRWFGQNFGQDTAVLLSRVVIIEDYIKRELGGDFSKIDKNLVEATLSSVDKALLRRVAERLEHVSVRPRVDAPFDVPDLDRDPRRVIPAAGNLEEERVENELTRVIDSSAKNNENSKLIDHAPEYVAIQELSQQITPGMSDQEMYEIIKTARGTANVMVQRYHNEGKAAELAAARALQDNIFELFQSIDRRINPAVYAHDPVSEPVKAPEPVRPEPARPSEPRPMPPPEPVHAASEPQEIRLHLDPNNRDPYYLLNQLKEALHRNSAEAQFIRIDSEELVALVKSLPLPKKKKVWIVNVTDPKINEIKIDINRGTANVDANMSFKQSFKPSKAHFRVTIKNDPKGGFAYVNPPEVSGFAAAGMAQDKLREFSARTINDLLTSLLNEQLGGVGEVKGYEIEDDTVRIDFRKTPS